MRDQELLYDAIVNGRLHGTEDDQGNVVQEGVYDIVRRDRSIVNKPISSTRNTNDDRPTLPLRLAIENNRADIAMYLFRQGASVTLDPLPARSNEDYHRTKRILKIIDIALRHGCTDLIHSLNQARLIPNDHKKYMTILMKSTDDIEITKILINHGADINAVGQDERTQLHRLIDAQASQRDIWSMVKEGANPFLKDKDGRTAITMKPEYFTDEVITNEFRTVILRHTLNQANRLHAIFPNTRGYDDLLHITNDLEIADWLLAHGADVNAKNKHGNTLLHSNRSPEVVEVLLARGADVNAKDNIGRTPLHTTYSQEISSLLLEAGANPHLKGDSGLSAIDMHPGFFHPQIIERVYNKAFREKNIKAIENIGRHFPDIFTRITHEQQHLREAIQSNDTELAQTLITQKARVNITLQGGNTPLHWAAANGFVDMVKLITPQIADINVRNADGKTALYLAVERGDLAMATHLISHNADVNIPDANGHSPLDIAIDKKFTQIGALLVSNDAEANKPLPHSHQAALDKSRENSSRSR